MTRRWLGLGAIALALGLLGAFVGGGRGAAGPSVGNSSDEGLLAAMRYLQERGFRAEPHRRPLSELPADAGVLVIGLPWVAMAEEGDLDAVRRHLLTGGSVLVLGSGRKTGPSESELLDALDIASVRLDAPERWSDRWAWLSRPVRAEPVAEWPGPLAFDPSRYALRPEAPGGALYRAADGREVAWLTNPYGGRLLTLADASPWSNRRLRDGANLAFLETAMLELAGPGGAVRFDEWHLGHRDPAPGDAPSRALAFDLLLVQLGLLYIAGAWVLGRRFGPPRAERAAVRGSVERDLRVIGQLHRKGGHAAQAGVRLLASFRHLARYRPVAVERLPERFEGGARELVALARAVGESQRENRV